MKIATLSCFEPAAYRVEISRDILMSHILVAGASGAGKTTCVVNPLIEQMIAHKRMDQEHKLGMLVLDLKGDDTIEKVETWALQSGREDDVRVLSLNSGTFYNPLHELRRLSDVDRVAGHLVKVSQEMGSENAYWTESRIGFITSALVFLLATSETLTMAQLLEFLRRAFLANDSQFLINCILQLAELIESGGIDKPTEQRLQMAISDFRVWSALESKTRDSHRSCIANVVRPLSACGCLWEGNAEFVVSQVLAGKILVASIDAKAHPEVGAFLSRALKTDFFRCLSGRVFQYRRDRICALVVDEFGLSATEDDADELAVCRSRGGAVIAGTQSVSVLERRLGYRETESLLANFNSVFVFRTHEKGLLDLARRAVSLRDNGCRPEDLRKVSTLGTYQAFVRLIDSEDLHLPVWFEPQFFNSDSPAAPESIDSLHAARIRLREIKRLGGSHQRIQQGCDFLRYMQSRHPLQLTPSILQMALEEFPKGIRPACGAILDLLELDGIDRLPGRWISAILPWLQLHPNLLKGVVMANGILLLDLEPRLSFQRQRLLRLQEELNLRVYPSLWRPLQKRHRLYLEAKYPDLEDVFSSAENPRKRRRFRTTVPVQWHVN